MPAATMPTAPDRRRTQRGHGRRAAVAERVGGPGEQEEAAVDGDAQGEADERGGEELDAVPGGSTPRRPASPSPGRTRATMAAAIGIVDDDQASAAQRHRVAEPCLVAGRRVSPPGGAARRCGWAARRSRTGRGTRPCELVGDDPARHPAARRSRAAASKIPVPACWSAAHPERPRSGAPRRPAPLGAGR